MRGEKQERTVEEAGVEGQQEENFDDERGPGNGKLVQSDAISRQDQPSVAGFELNKVFLHRLIQ